MNMTTETDTIIPTPENEMDRLVSGPRLLEILWDEASRPSIRWLRDQQRRRSIPFMRVGRLIWFCPRQVKDHMAQWQLRARERRSLRRPPFKTEVQAMHAVGAVSAVQQ